MIALQEAAQQAGAVMYNGGPHFDWEGAARFADIVIAAERERCARIVESRGMIGYGSLAIAAVIRSGAKE